VVHPLTFEQIPVKADRKKKPSGHDAPLVPNAEAFQRPPTGAWAKAKGPPPSPPHPSTFAALQDESQVSAQRYKEPNPTGAWAKSNTKPATPSVILLTEESKQIRKPTAKPSVISPSFTVSTRASAAPPQPVQREPEVKVDAKPVVKAQAQTAEKQYKDCIRDNCSLLRDGLITQQEFIDSYLAIVPKSRQRNDETLSFIRVCMPDPHQAQELLSVVVAMCSRQPIDTPLEEFPTLPGSVSQPQGKPKQPKQPKRKQAWTSFKLNK
jgi:hypothetical protein